MLTLYYAPRTRSVRIRWLLEELDVPHELKRFEFSPPSKPFSQDTPSGKFPYIDDDGIGISESGAIIEYILERYGGGRLAPPIGDPARGEFLQWLHYSEATAYPPLGVVIWHTMYKKNADDVPEIIADARQRAEIALEVIEKALDGKDYLLGKDFSAADIMMGFTIAVASFLGVLDERFPNIAAYYDRLTQRPAFQRAIAD